MPTAARPPRGAYGLLVALAVLFGPAYAALGGLRPPVVLSLGLSSATLLLAVLARRRPGPAVEGLFAFALSLGAAVHYASTGAVHDALGSPLRDDALAAVDARLFGGVFPGGQAAVLIDRSPILGPATVIGRVLSDLFQVAYVSYYAWGAALFFLLLARALRRPDGDAWDTLRAFLVAWVGAYLVNFAAYLVVPAMGPWWAHPEWFAHEIDGLVVAGPLRGLVAENQVTPDCFPSGHTALSWIVALVALRVAPRYGRVAVVGAVLISLATVGLRYHYAVDVLAAVPLVLLGLAAGGFLRRGVA